ncbi:hypothetical protein Hanom_Chr14g01287451 [Helianthus anomalus]
MQYFLLTSANTPLPFSKAINRKKKHISNLHTDTAYPTHTLKTAFPTHIL